MNHADAVACDDRRDGMARERDAGAEAAAGAIAEINVSVRLSGEMVERVERAAAAVGETRQQWMEKAIGERLGDFRIAESA